jgi:hypothetical protein
LGKNSRITNHALSLPHRCPITVTCRVIKPQTGPSRLFRH